VHSKIQTNEMRTGFSMILIIEMVKHKKH